MVDCGVIKALKTNQPVHVDVAFSQSGTKFGFRTLVADLGQGAHTHVNSEKLMYTSSFDAKRFCTSCEVPHSIWSTEEVNILLSDQHVPATVPNHEGRCMIQLVYGNATLDTLRGYMFLPIEIDKGANNCSDRNGAVDILQEAVQLEKKINLFLVSGTSCLLSGPTGYIHSMQEIFFTLNCTVFLPFKGWKSLKTINFPAPLMVRPEVSGKGLIVRLA